MLAFVLDEGPPRLVYDRARPEPVEALVRVRTVVAGICNTDLELARGYMKHRGVLGHEFVGVAIDGVFAGRRVVGGINFGCGSCDACSRDLARHCANRRVLGILGADGTLAEEFLIPEANLVEVPALVSDCVAAFAEPAAAACEILEQLGSVAGRDALVLGDGKLGCLIAQVLVSDGARTTLVGHHLHGLDWLAECGIRLAPEARAGARFDLVVDATGSPHGLAGAIEACAPRSTLVLKTTVAGRHEIDLAPLVINEVNVVGSRCGRMEPALERLADGRILVEPLIDARMPLASVEVAFAAAAKPGVRKVLVEVG
jgi:threonine dehydrogenase-like Zn-dependent dehydrogenase